MEGCNNESSKIVNYKLIDCVLPSIPYGAPIVKTKLRVDQLGNIKEILIIQSSGIKEIDLSVLKEVATCKIDIQEAKTEIWIDKTFTWTENIGRQN